MLYRSLGLLLLLMIARDLGAQEDRATESIVADRSEILFGQFDKTASRLGIVSKDGQTYQWNKDPLFRFSSEGKVFGSVYVWTDKSGRLAIVGTLGSIPLGGADWEFVELHLLKPKPIQMMELEGSPAKTWQPDVEELQLRKVPTAREVATNANLRMVQMRRIARQFTAEMSHDGQANQLRLLPQPIFRYEKSTSKLDGALFAYVWDNGTDPEVLLRVEVSEVDGESTWHYQPIRFTWRKVTLKLEGERVWEAPEFFERNDRMQRTPYLTGLTKQIP